MDDKKIEPLSQEDARRLEALLGAVEDGLASAVPGFEIVDRDLEIGAGRIVDLVALDGARRLVFVMLVSGGGEEALGSVADAVLYARRNSALFAQHWEVDPPARLDLEPSVVLVSDGYQPEALERLGLLGGVDLRLFELREMKSASAARVYLIPCAADGGPPGTELSLESFLAGLPDGLADTARALVQRVERVDDGLERTVTRTGIHWAYEGQPSGSLVHADGRLEGGVPGAGASPVQTPADVDPFVELVLARHLERLRDDVPAVERPRNGLGQLDLAPGVELLTAEEIEAFRE